MTAAPRIAVLDYGMGNRRSVEKALEHVGAVAEITGDPPVITAADGLVVPGVGAFPTAMARLRALGLDRAVGDFAAAGRPVLGICLGMQLLFDSSQEFELTSGLGLLPGTVTPLEARGRRVPHIGWNEVRFEHPCALTAGLPEAGSAFYHVHSLVARPACDDDVLASTSYGERFAAMVGRANVLGVQFHPEKSSRAGLRMLANFAGLCRPAPSPAASPASLRA